MDGATTFTWTVDVRAEVLPVMVIVLSDESPPVETVAVANPVASVVAWVT